MSTKPATCLYDGTTIHEDSEESAALAYLAALGKPAAEVTVDGKSTRYYMLSNDDGDLGNVCQEGIFALESLFEARVQNSYNACYRVIEYAELSCGDAVHAHGTTSRGRLPDGSYVLVAKVCDRMA